MMGSVDIKEAAEFLKRREERRKEANHKRWEQAYKDFQRIVETIVNKYHPRRIYQWGSVLNPENFTEYSDIDVAVEGIESAEDYFALLGDIMELTNFEVDLVQLEKIHPLHADSIKKHGKLIYDRETGYSSIAGRVEEDSGYPGSAG